MYSPNRQSTSTPNYGNSVAARAAAPGQQAKLARNLMGRGMPAHADGAVVAPDDPVDAQIEARRLLAKLGYELDGPAGLPPSPGRNEGAIGGDEIMPAMRRLDENTNTVRDPDTSRGALSDMRSRARTRAGEASYIRSKYRNLVPRHADGAVVAPESSPWEKLWKIITGKSTQEALNKSASTGGPQPMTPPSDDISVVRRAAEEAGKRNEEASNKKQPNIPKYCNGGVVR